MIRTFCSAAGMIALLALSSCEGDNADTRRFVAVKATVIKIKDSSFNVVGGAIGYAIAGPLGVAIGGGGSCMIGAKIQGDGKAVTLNMPKEKCLVLTEGSVLGVVYIPNDASSGNYFWEWDTGKWWDSKIVHTDLAKESF